MAFVHGGSPMHGFHVPVGMCNCLCFLPVVGACSSCLPCCLANLPLQGHFCLGWRRHVLVTPRPVAGASTHAPTRWLFGSSRQGILGSSLGSASSRYPFQCQSPSSSASDIDNLNHTTVDKAPLSKSISSPQVVGSHIIAARNCPNIVRLLNYVQDVNFATEASRKSRIAFAAANAKSGATQFKDGILSVKAALDFNFQDVEGLVSLVRLAFDSISN